MAETTNDLMNDQRLTFADAPDGSVEARFQDGMMGEIVCRYWRIDNPGTSDPWRYTLETLNGKGGTFSHPTEHGCRIAIVRHLIDAGCIEIPFDNGHLDDRNLAEAVAIEHERNAMNRDRPLVGDFVIMPDGTLERCCSAARHGMQTTEGGSFWVGRGGGCSYSGSLNKPRLWEFFTPTDQIKRGSFWFFSHGIAGAGRRVDFYLPCRVFRLEPRNMDEAEARNHPMAKDYAEFWGENHPDHLHVIAKLMAGE